MEILDYNFIRSLEFGTSLTTGKITATHKELGYRVSADTSYDAAVGVLILTY